MKILLSVTILLSMVPAIAWSQGGRCEQAANDLESQDRDVFDRGLQGAVDNDCVQLLPKIANLFLSGDVRASFYAADALALSRKKEYGPVLIRAYCDASMSKSLFPDRPLALLSAVLLACSDLPRGKRLRDIDDYIKRPPLLNDECIAEYRKCLEGHYDEYPVNYFAMELLQETIATNSLDMISRYLRSKNPDDSRYAAIIALQHVPLDSSLELFKEGLEDNDESVRYQAVRLLSGMEDSRVVSLFKERLPRESDPQLIDIMKKRLEASPR